ncbi:hypothetical protein [Paenibacillus ginsengarvi]|uniref:Uncharacterized protein n=1 Tax=Paenibacillus ginsengarvi TaxID=400777 RepID=A0A3B0C823_9BACL|nr:hypothetical protein [Paenibacillus ginsengarvi]RKN82205.1 hypothetical protein D7M11_17835 [Paenibacillus ginsengarvi]
MRPGNGASAAVPVSPVPDKADHKVTIVTIPGWSFLDWSEDVLSQLPTISLLIREGAIGAMNVRIPEKGLEDLYVTLGAGAPASSSPEYGAWPVNRGGEDDAREGGKRYRRLTGREPGEAAIVLPEIEAILRRNDIRSQRPRPGLFGEMLRKTGIPACVIGNSDTPPDKKRYAPLLLMDEKGRVPCGRIDESVLAPDDAAPSRVKTNAAALLQAWQSVQGTAVVVLEWGDLLRFQSEQPLYEGAQAKRQKLSALSRLDSLLGDLLAAQRNGDSIWLLSPFVGSEASRSRELLAPVIYTGPGVAGGLLTSPSTRRSGIVTASDFAPSVLASLGIEAPQDMVGQPMEVIARPGAWTALSKQLDTIKDIYRLRPRLLLPFVSVEAIVMLGALLVIWWKPRKAVRWVEWLLLAIMAAPLVLLMTGWLNVIKPLPAYGQAALFIGGSALIAAFCLARSGALQAAVAVSGITAAALLLDGLFGAEGMKRSVLGYDPMVGARYYGMGNEYMGVLVGAVTLVFAAMLERRRRTAAPAAPASPASRTAAPAAPASPASRTAEHAHRRRTRVRAAGLAALALAVPLLYLAAPQLGTNAGGAVTAAVAFGLAWLRSFAGGAARRLGLLPLVLVCAALVAAGFASLWLLNAAIPAEASQQSHIGRAMAALGDGRTDLIAAMIVRKLQMNVHLIGVSVWTKVLAAGLIVMAVAVVRPRGAFRRWESEHPFYMNGFIAIAVGSVAALAFNDSGIVAAATMIVYAAVPMLLMRLQEDKSPHSA